MHTSILIVSIVKLNKILIMYSYEYRRGFMEDQIIAALSNYQREAGETAEGALERMETEKDADVVLRTDLVILILFVCEFSYKAEVLLVYVR